MNFGPPSQKLSIAYLWGSIHACQRIMRMSNWSELQMFTILAMYEYELILKLET